MPRRIALVSLVLGSACGPALPSGREHPASADALEAPVPPLASALTEDPAPPPPEVEAAARAYATDGDRGVAPPASGAQVRAPGSPPPSRDPRARGEGHEHHAGRARPGDAHEHP